MRTAIHALVFLLICTSPLAAAKPAWDIDDVILAESIRDIQVSPDGRSAVWVHVAPNKEHGETLGNLVRLDLATGRETILTRGTETSVLSPLICGVGPASRAGLKCRSARGTYQPHELWRNTSSHPRWSPDGQRLAYLRSHEDKNQIWLIDPSGGEPWPLTEWPSSVLHFDWAGPDALLFAAQQTPTLRASSLKEEKDDTVVVEDERHEPPVRLFRVEASSRKVTRLTENRDRIDNLAVSPDGKTVTFGELRIGRFEVTRAQFAEFDKAYKVEPGRDNYPANGITFEQAKDYCAWLSKQTGRTYRLPTEDEAEELYEQTEGNENTLDHWAGYAVNPDDAARLRETLKKQDSEALLLKEVGSFRAAGTEEAVFDLSGNVAEWVTTKDGKGAVRGGSADAPADSTQKKNQAAASHYRFRVVQETGAR